MKNLKIKSTKNSSIFKVAALTILFTVFDHYEAMANVEDLLRNPVIKYSVIGAGFLLIIVFTILTSFKGGSKTTTDKKPKAVSHHHHVHPKDKGHLVERRGAPAK